MVVAPTIVLVTFQRLLHQASASCVGLRPCFCATCAYSPTASRASDLLYLCTKARAGSASWLSSCCSCTRHCLLYFQACVLCYLQAYTKVLDEVQMHAVWALHHRSTGDCANAHLCA